MRQRLLPAFALSSLALAAAGCGGAQSANTELPPECLALDTPDDWGVPIAPLPQQQTGVLLHNAVVLTAAGDVFEPGWVHFDGGRIVAVGAGDAPADLADVESIDLGGRYLTPGIIDTHSHLGVYATPSVQATSEGNEATSPNTAQVQAVDSIWIHDPGFERAIAGGITSLMILPGSANLIGGHGFTMKLRHGARNAQELAFPGAPATMKMACGENPRRVYGSRGQMPSTRMGAIATVRQAWTDAAAYRRKADEYRDELRAWCDAGAPEAARPEAPAVDLRSEALASVLRGDTLPQVHCYRADEMLEQIAIAEEFGFTIRSFHHAVEAYKIRDVLATYPIAVSTWADWWGFKLEAWDSIVENAALLHEAGAVPVIHSDSEIGIQRLNQEAAKAWAAGIEAGVELDQNDAIRWITWNAAWALGIEDQTGSIEPGKMADLVVWSAHPLSIYARAELVWVDGVLEFDRSAPARPWSDFELGLWPHLEGNR